MLFDKNLMQSGALLPVPKAMSKRSFSSTSPAIAKGLEQSIRILPSRDLES
jgi:hypothetical protein